MFILLNLVHSNKISGFVFLVLLTIYSCDNFSPECGEVLESNPNGSWFFGDIHVHSTGASNDTGGDSDLNSIKQKAIDRSIDFVVLTDHSNSTGSDADTTYEDPSLFNQGPEFPYWDEAAALSSVGVFLMIDGNEISPRSPDDAVATGHFGCLPMNLSTFDTSFVFTDRPMGSVTGAETLLQAKQAGCYSVVNHPYTQAPWIAFDWSSFDYDAIEVWNGTLGFDEFDQHSYDAWICDLLAGRSVTAVGGSDNHRVNLDAPGFFLDPALGYPSTAVFAESLSWDAIMTGLSNGETSIFEGESRLYLEAFNRDNCIDNLNFDKFRMIGKLDNEVPQGTLRLYHYVSCNDPRPATDSYPQLTFNLLLEKDISGGESFEEIINIDGSSGVYAATLSNSSTHYWALSRAHTKQ